MLFGDKLRNNNIIKSELNSINKIIESELISTCKILNIDKTNLAFLLSGKRLRSKLLIFSNVIKRRSERIKVASMIELIHAASLIHDDIIDKSNLRRGNETINFQYNNQTALSLGYLIFSRIFIKILTMKGLIYDEFIETIKDMCKGEIDEINSMYDLNRTEESYINTINKKTGSLFSISCSINSNRIIRDLKEFGQNYGILFQIIDDIKDIFSKSEIIGKPVLQDLGSGVYSLPIIYFLQSKNQKEKIGLSEVKVDEFKEFIKITRDKALCYIKLQGNIVNNKLKREMLKLKRELTSNYPL